MDEDKGLKTIPNAISAFRGLIAVVVVVLILRYQYEFALACFVFAAGTDWIDGFIAKRFNQKSTVGKVLDTVVDKLLIIGALSTLALTLNDPQVWLCFTVIIVREVIVILAKRAKIRSTGRVESAAEAGRFSMVAQSIATGLLFVWAISPDWKSAALASLWFSVGASLTSGWVYVQDARNSRRKKE